MRRTPDQALAEENAERTSLKRRKKAASGDKDLPTSVLQSLVPATPFAAPIPVDVIPRDLNVTSASPSIVVLDEHTLLTATKLLAAKDPDFATIFSQFGAPPLWARAPGFPTLIHIILEQQVSLASANAAFNRLKAVADPLTPHSFLSLDDAQLLAVGFSRQKTAYGRGLASAVAEGRLDLHALAAQSDDTVRATLTQLKGIGPWTANIYLLMALLRADVWPQGDLALATAVQQVKRLAKRPTTDELVAMSRAWQPYRAVAARLFWHHYLSVRKPKGD